jgi:hypothetical protein
VAYVIIGLIVVVGGAVLFGAHHVHEESSPGSRPSMIAARRAMRQSRMVASSDQCVCGGTLQPIDVVSDRFGTLQGCDGCHRAWSEDGRTTVRRRRIRRPQPSGPGRDVPSL